jgi:hypothetical protein
MLQAVLLETLHRRSHRQRRADVERALFVGPTLVPAVRYGEDDAEAAQVAVSRIRYNEVAYVSNGEVDGELVRLEVELAAG